MGKSAREKNYGASGPGPGSYNLKPKINDGPQFIMGDKCPKDPFKNKSKVGPGQYNPKDQPTQLSYSIRTRDKSANLENKISPGPGHYNSLQDLYYKNIPGSKIGRNERKSDNFIHTASVKKPAPGQYNGGSHTMVDKNSAPKYGFGSSSREKNYFKTIT